MSRMEVEMVEAQVNILHGKFDMIISAGRDAGRLFDRICTDYLAILRGHLRRVDFLIKQRRNISAGPVFLLVMR